MPITRAIRVLIVDDHAIVREGLKQIIANTDDLIVAGETDSGNEAVQMHRLHACDVLLLDISMPIKCGIEVLKQFKSEFPLLPVLMLSMHREDMYAFRLLKAGAAGYLSKQSAPAELISAIRDVAAGRKYISSALAQELASQINNPKQKDPHETLSNRELQTLMMIAKGQTVSEIAARLSLSVKTISMYRARLLQKMNLRHNADLTQYAMHHNLAPGFSD